MLGWSLSVQSIFEDKWLLLINRLWVVFNQYEVGFSVVLKLERGWLLGHVDHDFVLLQSVSLWQQFVRLQGHECLNWALVLNLAIL